MLTFDFVKDSGQASQYFEQTDDYYTRPGHRGEWDGNGAKALGLDGGVDPQLFKELLDGRLPDGRQIRKPMPHTQGDGKKSNARLGIDFTFSAPKSVSIAALVLNDRRVIEAHDAAVKDAIGLLQQHAIARQKIKGTSFRQHTNKLVVAKFQHDLSRDQDPQLHTHAVTMNLTQRADGRWVALSNEDMLKNVKVVGAFYRAQLAQRLERMGYDIRATRNGFELASIPDKAIEMFSKRSRAIEAQLSEKGLTRDTASGEQKQNITKGTRKVKDEGDRVALRAEWQEALAAAGIDLGAVHPDIKPETPPEQTFTTVDGATYTIHEDGTATRQKPDSVPVEPDRTHPDSLQSDDAQSGTVTPKDEMPADQSTPAEPRTLDEPPTLVGFTTAKGSTYTVHEDGTTTRDKAARSDVGHEGDSGIKPRTERTVYVEENAARLSAAGLNGLGEQGARVVIKDDKATLLTWNERENRWGASPSSRNISVFDKPAAGLYPLELWKRSDDVPGYEAYRGMHAGNKITDIRYVHPETAAGHDAESNNTAQPEQEFSPTNSTPPFEGSNAQHDSAGTPVEPVRPNGDSIHPESQGARSDTGATKQESADRIFFVTERNAETLRYVESRGEGKRIASLPDGRYGVAYTTGSKAGTVDPRTVVDVSTRPASGLIPVELWEDGARFRFGSRIDAMPPAKSPESSAEASPAAPDKPVGDGGDGGDDGGKNEQDRARNAIDFAIEHLSERQGIFTKNEVLERAYMRSLGSTEAVNAELQRAEKDGRLIPELPLYQSAKSFSREMMEKSVDKHYDKFRHDNEIHKLTKASWVSMLVNVDGYTKERAEQYVENAIAVGRLVEVERRYTTSEMKQKEDSILWRERTGRDTVESIRPAAEVDAMLATSGLNDGQKAAARLILTTQNRFIGVQGYAGVGKSHMMSKTVEAIKAETVKQAEKGGYTVIGLAPYGSQNKALQELGMESQTLASFLVKKQEPGLLGPKTIVFLDEASVVPAHQMESLMERIQQSGARLIMVGDRKQTQAVESGKPFEQLQDAGMSLAHVVEIQRQKVDTLKSAVEQAAAGKIEKSVNILASDKRIVEIQPDGPRRDALAKYYANLPEEQRNATLIVVGTNDARRQINDLVRGKLNLPPGEMVRSLESYDMTRAEHKQAASYETGIVLIAEKGGAHGLQRKEHYIVEGINAPTNTLTLSDRDGNRRTVEASQLSGVSTYRLADIEIVKGDWLRITRNDNQQGVFNGERHRVAAVEKDAIVLEGGARLSREKAIHAQHGYAQTVHSAQGLTRKGVIIEADTRSLTSNRAVYYVAISRSEYDLKIFTDDRRQLPDAMKREPKKYAANEIRSETREAMVLGALSASRRQQGMTKEDKQAFAKDAMKPQASPRRQHREHTSRPGRKL